MSLFDTSSEFGQRAERRLREEWLAWLTTVDVKGMPQPVPVWFLWDGADSVLIYSKPDTPKLRAIARNPRVSLNLDGNGKGGDIVVLLGEAAVSADPPAHVPREPDPACARQVDDAVLAVPPHRPQRPAERERHASAPRDRARRDRG